MIMKGYRFLILVTVVLLANGCASSLRHESEWPRIRATAVNEVTQREGDSRWARDAYFNPTRHADGVWGVKVSARYPLSRPGDSIDLRIRDGGEVVSYLRRFTTYPQYIEHVPNGF
jgi:uncharacterized protein YceK